MTLEELRNRSGDLQTQLDAIQIKLNAEKDKDESAKIMAEARTLLDEQKGIDEQIELQLQMEKRKEGFELAEERAEIKKESLKVIATPEEKRELSFGEYLQCVALAGSPEGEFKDIRNIGGKRQAVKQLRAYIEKETRATGLSESIPSDGGFLVGTDFSKELITKAHDASVLAGRVRQVRISSGSNGIAIPGIDEQSRATGSRWGGVQGYWLDEAAAKTKSKPKFRKIELKLNKLAALAYTTDELLQDASVLEAIIFQAMVEEIAFLVDDAIFRGTGAGQPLGFLGHAGTVSVAKEGGQAADTIVFPNIVKMFSRLWPRSHGNAIFLANIDILPQLMQMSVVVGTAGVPVWLPANSLAGQPYQTLMGKPLIFIEQCSTLGDLGDIVLADLSQYILADKGGVQKAASMHVQFIYDEMVFRFVYRVDGQPIWNAPLTPFKGTNTQSPFVTLDAR